MTGRIFVFIFSIGLLASCSPSRFAVSDNIKKLEIGMTEKKAVRTMGKNYEVVSATGSVRILAYETNDNAVYILRFVDDLLTGWDKEYIRAPRKGIHSHNRATDACRHTEMVIRQS